MRHEDRLTNHRDIRDELALRVEDDVPAEVYTALHRIVNGHAIERWWRMPMAQLDGMTPETAWKTGHEQRVRDFVKRYSDPSFT